MRFKLLITLLALLFVGTLSLQAQDQPAKKSEKVIVIEKIINENGNESTEKIVLQGEEAEEYLRENGESINLDGDEKIQSIDIRVEDEGEGANVWITRDGDEKVIEIDGENEIEIIEQDGATIKIIRSNADSNEEIEVIQDGNGTKTIKKRIRTSKSSGQGGAGQSDEDLMKRFGMEDVNMDDIKTININRNNDTETLEIEFKDGKKMKKVITSDDMGMGFFLHQDKEDAFMRGANLHEHIKKPCDTKQAFLGITMNDFSDDAEKSKKGVKVIGISAHSGAEAAGLAEGDIITSIDGKAIESSTDISAIIKGHNIGDKIDITLDRGAQNIILAATLGKRNCDNNFSDIRHFQGKSPVVRTNNFRRDYCKPLIGFFHNKEHTERGVRVGNIVDETPAYRKNLQTGDVIIAFDGVDIKSWDHLIELRDRHEAGDRFKMTILRDGKSKKFKANFNECKQVKEEPEVYEFDLDEDIVVEGKRIDFNVFPNPSQGQVSVEYEGNTGPLNIRITDITGKVLVDRTIDDFTGRYAQSFDFQNSAEGVLIIRLQQGDDVSVKRVVIQKAN